MRFDIRNLISKLTNQIMNMNIIVLATTNFPNKDYYNHYFIFD